MVARRVDAGLRSRAVAGQRRHPVMRWLDRV